MMMTMIIIMLQVRYVKKGSKTRACKSLDRRDFNSIRGTEKNVNKLVKRNGNKMRKKEES